MDLQGRFNDKNLVQRSFILTNRGRPSFRAAFYACVKTLICLFCFTSGSYAQSTKKAIYKDIYIVSTQQELIFGNDSIHLVFGPADGRWTGFYVSSSAVSNLLSGYSMPDFKIEGSWVLENHTPPLQEYSVSIDARHSEVTLQLQWLIMNDYLLTTSFIISPKSLVVQRSSTITRKVNSFPEYVKFEGFKFELTKLAIGETADCSITVPGPFFPHTFVAPSTSYDSLTSKELYFHSAPDAGFGLLELHNSKLRRNIALWMNTSGEVNYIPYLKGNGRFIDFGHHNLRHYYLRPGTKIFSDTQIIALATRQEENLLRYKTSLRKEMPIDSEVNSQVKDMILLEIYPEYYKGGFKEIAEKLDFYKTIGFTAIYLMPHWVGGYSPIDLYQINTHYGTVKDLKDLVKKAHKLEIKVFFDMVIHGFNQQSPLPRQQPEMFIHNPDGTLAVHPVWKSISTDWASRAYQQYMVDLVLHDLKEYDVDGYRVDAASYKGANWDKDISYPAYTSGTYAPVLMDKMLKALRKQKADAIFLNEVFGPVFYTVSNLSHDNQTEAIQFLMERMEQGRYHAEMYKQHLSAIYAMLPDDANRVFFSRNHDTSWFYHFNGYSPLYFCFEAIHAFFGIPEVFTGDPKHPHNPDDDPRIFDTYRKIFSLRKSYPELSRGVILLEAVTSDSPDVFSGLRSDGQSISLIAINMSKEEVDVTLTLKGDQFAFENIMFSDVLANSPVPCKKQARNSALVKIRPYQILHAQLKKVK